MSARSGADGEGAADRVAVGLGSNRGDRAAHLRRAVEALSETLADLRRSRVYETRPRGAAAGGRHFLNMCCVGGTTAEPGELLEALLAIEARAGRRRPAPRGAARTLDLDLLLFGDRVVERPGLVVPHPRMTRRAFVLVPLAEVAGEWVHPRAGRTIEEMAAQASTEGIRAHAEG